MPLFDCSKRQLRSSFFSIIFGTGLFFSAVRPAQLTLTYRLLSGYSLGSSTSINKSKPTLFVFEQSDPFGQVFQPIATESKQSDVPNFAREMVIGIALPPTNKPPKLSISRIFVQDSTLTVRYIRIADTTTTADRLISNPQSYTAQPMLLVALPKQTVLKTKLVENGKVVETLRKAD